MRVVLVLGIVGIAVDCLDVVGSSWGVAVPLAGQVIGGRVGIGIKVGAATEVEASLLLVKHSYLVAEVVVVLVTLLHHR